MSMNPTCKIALTTKWFDKLCHEVVAEIVG
jgi:hypothetical protein